MMAWASTRPALRRALAWRACASACRHWAAHLRWIARPVRASPSPSQWRHGARESDTHQQAFAPGAGAEFKLGVVQLGDIVHDGQSQAGAAGIGLHGGRRAVERREYTLAVF